jgi:hypothetical protein
MRILFLFCLHISVSFAQSVERSDSLIFFASQKKKGVYRDFTEFRNNAPSIPYTGIVEERPEFLSLFEGTYTAYKLVFSKDSLPCPKRTPIWGFCDGSTIFICRAATFKKKNVYDKIIFLGRYIYYQSTTESSGGGMMMSSGGMMMGGSVGRMLVEYVMNGNTGNEERLTKDLVRHLLAKDKDLANAFEEEKTKKKVLGEYVIKYAVKHHDEIKE